MRLFPLLLLVACGPRDVPASGSSNQAGPAAGPNQLMVFGHAVTPETVDPKLHALGIRDGRITKVQRVGMSIARTGLPEGEVRLRADRITPGFVDAHAHPAGLGRSLAEVDLNVGSYGQVLDAVESWAKQLPADAWVTGRGWDQNDWQDGPAGGWPRAVDLDARLSGRRAALRRIDGHAMWVSSSVLRDAGITAATEDPSGGQILRDAAGRPTGVLIDTAMGLVDVPAPPEEERERQLRAALDTIAASGLTGVHDMGVGDSTLALYEKLDRAGELPVRVWAYLDPESEAAQRLLKRGPWSRNHLKVVGIKVYADGALGSRGALLGADYSDHPGHQGLAITDEEAVYALTTKALSRGAQVAVHAIGDEAVHEVLNAFERARNDHPDKWLVPLRVEHAQVVRPEDQGRFAELNVIASMQPTHATSDAPWAEERLGPERIGWAYAWRSLRRRRAELAFGSDFPVEEVDPSLGLWAATTRGGWTAEETLTLEEAITAFTLGSAYAVGEEERLGIIDERQIADLTLWNEGEDGRLRAVATVVDGAVVWKAEGVEVEEEE